MIEEEKQQMIKSFTKFYMLYRKELLDLAYYCNSALSPLLCTALYEIYLHEDITSSMLSKRLDITIPNTSRCLCTLSSLGYIIKFKDYNDKRITHIKLSTEGQSLVENSFYGITEMVSDTLGILEVKDLIKLSEAVLILKDLFDGKAVRKHKISKIDNI